MSPRWEGLQDLSCLCGSNGAVPALGTCHWKMALAEPLSSDTFAIPAMQSSMSIPNNVPENHGPMDGYCLVHAMVLLHTLSFGDISLLPAPFPVPPQITAGPSPVTVMMNEPVTLECNATGTPAPVLLWLKDGNLVSSMAAGGPQVGEVAPLGVGGSLRTSLQEDVPFPSSGFEKKNTIAGAEQMRHCPDLPLHLVYGSVDLVSRALGFLAMRGTGGQRVPRV